MTDKSLRLGQELKKGVIPQRNEPLLSQTSEIRQTGTGTILEDIAEDRDPSSLYEKGKVRLSLDVSIELNQLLESLARTMRVTKSDVLRKAIVLMKVALDAKLKNKKLAIVDEGQPVQTEIVGLF